MHFFTRQFLALQLLVLVLASAAFSVRVYEAPAQAQAQALTFNVPTPMIQPLVDAMDARFGRKPTELPKGVPANDKDFVRRVTRDFFWAACLSDLRRSQAAAAAHVTTGDEFGN